jgi:hypothetical protein
MHKGARGYSRNVVVRQVLERKDPSLYDWKSYIPIGNAAHKLRLWKNQGAEIMYLTSRTKTTEIEDIKNVLQKNSFPEGKLIFRRKGEEYRDVAERTFPEIIVEDDCESIGGKEQMTYTHIKPELRKRIRSIVVKEFGGTDHLSDNISSLNATESAQAR